MRFSVNLNFFFFFTFYNKISFALTFLSHLILDTVLNILGTDLLYGLVYVNSCQYFARKFLKSKIKLATQNCCNKTLCPRSI